MFIWFFLTESIVHLVLVDKLTLKISLRLKMNKSFKIICVLILCLAHSVYASDSKKAMNKTKIAQYTRCASSFLTTGFIKTAFNQQSDMESQALVTGGLAMALYAGWLSSPEYALSIYKQEQQKINKAAWNYIRVGSRDEIYRFTVSYLVPKNEKCISVTKEIRDAASKKDNSFRNFNKSKEAEKFMEKIVKSAQEIVVGKTKLPDFEENESYASVRLKMLNAGWKPFISENADSCMEGDGRCQDRPEMLMCSGSGMANCKFLWQKEGEVKAICTIGEGEAIYDSVCDYE